MPKVNYNSLSKNKRNRYYWRSSGRWASKIEIKQFKQIRSKVAVKRERKRKEIIRKYKPHTTISRNVRFITYCEKYNKGKGIIKLSKLFRSLRKHKADHVRFLVGSWKVYCLNKKKKCPKKIFYYKKRLKDRYRLPREQPGLTKDNFVKYYNDYLFEVYKLAQAIYKYDVCPKCDYDTEVTWITICFQIVRVRK